MNHEITHHPGSNSDFKAMYTIARTLESSWKDQGKSLCERCQSGQVMRREAPKGVPSDSTIFCRNLNRNVPPDIIECTGFYDAKRMSLTDMSMIAITIDPRIAVQDKSYL